MATKQRLPGPDFEVGIALDDLPQSTPVLGHAHGEAVVLVRTGDEVRAMGAVCSHYGGPLSEGLVVGDTLRCPWHHARFDLRTGDALGAPALNPVACYAVERRDARVKVGPRKSVPPSVRPPSTPGAIVIVGAGAAGAAAAERLRCLGCTGTITLIGDEAPVDRPNLSKDYLGGTAPEEWLPLRTREFYEGIGVDVRVGDAARSLDPARKTVTLESGQSISYDALLLAMGAKPVRLALSSASSAPRVFTLRTLADSREIIAAASLSQARRGDRLELHWARGGRLIASTWARCRRGESRPPAA